MNVKTTIRGRPPRADRHNQSHPLGHFEHAVLVAIQALGEKAYPAEITRSLIKPLRRHVALAQVYIALGRLAEKGLISTDSSSEISGRRKRVFHVEHLGIQAMKSTAAAFGVSPAVKETTDESETPPEVDSRSLSLDGRRPVGGGVVA